MNRALSFFIVFTFLTILLPTCEFLSGEGPSESNIENQNLEENNLDLNENGFGSIKLNVLYNEATEISYFEIIISDEAEELINSTLTPESGETSFHIYNIPSGIDRSIEVNAYDIDDTLIFLGSATADITADTESTIQIQLLEVNPPEESLGDAQINGFEVTPEEITFDYYGAAWRGDNLNNMYIGKYEGRIASFRFKAKYTKQVEKVILYLIHSYPGYYDGDGGHILMELQADDGSADHLPDGVTLASSLITDPLISFFRDFYFDSQVTINEGQLYHLVFTNPHNDPVNNYVSIDMTYSVDIHSPRQIAFTDDELGVIYKRAGNWPWEVNERSSPIFSLFYTDGANQGQCYIEFLSNSAVRTISGDNKVRQHFTVSDSTKIAHSTSVRIRKINDNGSLTVRLENNDGSLIEEGEISAADINSSMRYVTYNFTNTHDLELAQTYNLELSSTAGHFETYGMQEGDHYGMDGDYLFLDGYMQYNTGSGWITHRNESIDMQAYFRVEAN
ncbi:MAG: hypothetical protein ABIA04_11850 [Pseudomonadota bacterium]